METTETSVGATAGMVRGSRKRLIDIIDEWNNDVTSGPKKTRTNDGGRRVHRYYIFVAYINTIDCRLLFQKR